MSKNETKHDFTVLFGHKGTIEYLKLLICGAYIHFFKKTTSD